MQHRGPRRPPSEQQAPRWAALGAVVGVLLAGLLAIPGCLNPRPEEDPSALELADPQDANTGSADGDVPVASEAERETCDDNPLLSGCEPLPASPGANVDGPPPASEEPAAPADAGSPNMNDAGGADAGAASPADGSTLAE